MVHDGGWAHAGQAVALGSAPMSCPRPLSHGEINAILGEPGAYTEAVGTFPCSLDAAIAERLGCAKVPPSIASAPLNKHPPNPTGR